VTDVFMPGNGQELAMTLAGGAAAKPIAAGVQVLKKLPVLGADVVELAGDASGALLNGLRNVGDNFIERLSGGGVLSPQAGRIGAGGTLRQTGARSGELGPHDWDAAESVYDAIRTQDDIAVIAQNSGMPEFMVDRVKNHLFFKDDHIKWEGLGRMDADPLIANAWNRLTVGTNTQLDLQLMRHEYLESRFESLFKTDLETAHRRVSSRNPSGLE